MIPESTSAIIRPDLTAVVQEYDEKKAAGKFIGRKAAPVFESDEDLGTYPIFQRGVFKKRTKSSRAPGGKYNRIQGEMGSANFDCEDNGIEYPVDDKLKKRYRKYIDAEAAASRISWFQALINHEYRVSQLYANAGFSNTNVATAWSTAATAVPITDLQTGFDSICDKTGARQEDLSIIIPRADFREALETDQINDKVKYTYPGVQPANLRPAQLASMLGIKEVVVASAAYDTKEGGIAESNSQLWTAGVIYIALLAEENDDLDTMSCARTILFTEDSDEIPVMESYRDETVRSDIVRARFSSDEVLLGDDVNLFCYKLTNT